MNVLIILLLLIAPVAAQTADPPVEGMTLNWMERRYWNMVLDKFTTIEKKHNELQANLDRLIAAPVYPDQQRDIFVQKVDIAIHQKTYDEAREEFSKAKELFIKASTDKAARKLLNQQLKAALKKENDQTTAANSAYRSVSPYPSTFTIRCYSGGVGRYFWVRCRSSAY